MKDDLKFYSQVESTSRNGRARHGAGVGQCPALTRSFAIGGWKNMRHEGAGGMTLSRKCNGAGQEPRGGRGRLMRTGNQSFRGGTAMRKSGSCRIVVPVALAGLCLF